MKSTDSSNKEIGDETDDILQSVLFLCSGISNFRIHFGLPTFAIQQSHMDDWGDAFTISLQYFTSLSSRHFDAIPPQKMYCSHHHPVMGACFPEIAHSTFTRNARHYYNFKCFKSSLNASQLQFCFRLSLLLGHSSLIKEGRSSDYATSRRYFLKRGHCVKRTDN